MHIHCTAAPTNIGGLHDERPVHRQYEDLTKWTVLLTNLTDNRDLPELNRGFRQFIVNHCEENGGKIYGSMFRLKTPDTPGTKKFREEELVEEPVELRIIKQLPPSQFYFRLKLEGSRDAIDGLREFLSEKDRAGMWKVQECATPQAIPSLSIVKWEKIEIPDDDSDGCTSLQSLHRASPVTVYPTKKEMAV
jgi:hypothetical protein